MSWKVFKKYLEENIITKKGYYQLRSELTEEAKNKYGPFSSEEEAELISELELLIDSWENSYNNYSNSNNFHELPEIEESFSEKCGKIKSWKEVFPNREETFFGETTNDNPPSEAVFSILEKIYEEWRKPNRLEWFLKEKEEEAGGMLKEWGAKQAYIFFKEKNLDIINEMKQWLAEYETLSDEEKSNLEEDYQKLSEWKELLENAENNSSQTWWFQKLDWITIGASVGIGVVLVAIVLMIRKYLKV